MVSAGKKAAETRARGGWRFEGHLEGKSPEIRAIMEAVQEFTTALDEKIEEIPRKNYFAYRTTQNIACMEPQQQKVLLFLKLDPKKVSGPKGISRDMTDIGHYGTGDLEITVRSLEDVERAKPFIKQAYEEAGA
jgi:predicted transport protein